MSLYPSKNSRIEKFTLKRILIFNNFKNLPKNIKFIFSLFVIVLQVKMSVYFFLIINLKNYLINKRTFFPRLNIVI